MQNSSGVTTFALLGSVRVFLEISWLLPPHLKLSNASFQNKGLDYNKIVGNRQWRLHSDHCSNYVKSN